MSFEVEQKYQLADELEFQRFSQNTISLLLEQYQGSAPFVVEETDVYFNHPAKNYAQTDEALRLRYRKIGERIELYITYKGPKLDTQTKTRKELEIPLKIETQSTAQASLQNWESLLCALGFTPVGKVSKTRQKVKFFWEGRQAELSLDTVLPIGYFVEVELIAQCENDLAQTQQLLLQITNSLKLTNIVKKSYLDLVLNT